MRLQQIAPSHKPRRHISDRQRLCRQIHRQIILEFFDYRTAKREARLRILLGLSPIPRAISWERCSQ